MTSLLLLSMLLLPQATAQRAAPADYTVGPEDVLAITVVGEAVFTNKYRIGRDGSFEFPYLGSMKAAGQTLRGFEELLTTRLQKENILLRPQITIEVAEFRSQTMTVMGQVADQGMVALTGSKTIVDVLAGRLLPSAGDEIVINRRKAGRAEGAGPVLPDRTRHRDHHDLQAGRPQRARCHDGDAARRRHDRRVEGGVDLRDRAR